MHITFRNIRIFYFSILLIFISSCSNQDVKTVRLCRYIGLKEYPCEKIYLKIKKETNSVIYEYYDSTENKESKPTITKLLDTDSIIECDFCTCKLIDSRIYNVNQKRYKVNKYFYDEEFTIDEEYDIYFVDSIGLVISHSGHWGNYSLYIQDENSYAVINSILKDTTGFWPYNVWPYKDR